MLPGGTHGATGEGNKEGNLFCEVNRDLRELARTDLETCECLKKAWVPLL